MHPMLISLIADAYQTERRRQAVRAVRVPRRRPRARLRAPRPHPDD